MRNPTINWIAAGVLGGLTLIAASASGQKSGQADVLFERAVQKETVDGDLKGAIDQYKKLAQGKDRAVAARALVRIGQCYEKLGDAEARKAYERVVREFGDQKEAVAEARTFLAAKSVRAETGIVARLISNIGGRSYMGPLSNDGRYIAFTTSAGVFVHDLVSGQQRRLVANTTAEERLFGARISPDGKRVAYTRYPNAPGAPDWMCEIQMVGVDGSRPRLMAGGNDIRAYLWDWSPDGKQLLASRNHKPDDPSTERVLITVADGSQRVIGIGPMREARFSPDGKQIAFEKGRGTEGHSEIVLISTQGGAEITLVENGGYVTNPVWAPDGNKLLFVSNRRSGSNDMWLVRVAQARPIGLPEFVKERVDRIQDITPEGDCYYRTGTFSRDPYVASNQLWLLKNLFGEAKVPK